MRNVGGINKEMTSLKKNRIQLYKELEEKQLGVEFMKENIYRSLKKLPLYCQGNNSTSKNAKHIK